MSVISRLVVVAALAACQSKQPPRANPSPSSGAAAAATPGPGAARIPTAAPAPKLPPPPMAARAKLVVAAPAAARIAPNCGAVKLRLYADGVRRSCITASPERVTPDAQMLVSCGTRAELPAEKPLHLELRYELRGQELARIDLGDARTLQIGDQQLAGGAVTYTDRDGDGVRDLDRLCPSSGTKPG